MKLVIPFSCYLFTRIQTIYAGFYQLGLTTSTAYWFDRKTETGNNIYTSWLQDRDTCASLGSTGRLTLPQSDAENDFLGAVLEAAYPEPLNSAHDGFWINLHDAVDYRSTFTTFSEEVYWKGWQVGTTTTGWAIGGNYNNWRVESGPQPNFSGGTGAACTMPQNLRGYTAGTWKWADQPCDGGNNRFTVCQFDICMHTSDADWLTIFSPPINGRAYVFEQEDLTITCPAGQVVVLDGHTTPDTTLTIPCSGGQPIQDATCMNECNPGYGLVINDILSTDDSFKDTCVLPPTTRRTDTISVQCLANCAVPAITNGASPFNAASTISHMQAVKYECIGGYSIVGTAAAGCISGMLLPGPPPVCRKDCLIPDIDGSFIQTEQSAIVVGGALVKHGLSVKVKCAKYYRMVGKAAGTELTWTCQDGSLNGFEVVTCVKECRLPLIQNGGFDGYATLDFVTVGTQVTPVCDAQYETDLNGPFDCTSTRLLTGVHQCKTACQVPPIGNGGFEESSAGVLVPINSRLTPYCDTGFVSDVVNIITCEPDGLLTQQHVCTESSSLQVWCSPLFQPTDATPITCGTGGNWNAVPQCHSLCNGISFMKFCWPPALLLVLAMTFIVVLPGCVMATLWFGLVRF